MFKVGDKVVNDAFINSDIYVFKKLMPEIGMALIAHDEDEGACGLYSLRHATPEEIAAGHRIESSNDQAISDCTLSNLCQNDTQNSLPIKQENQDKGDDSHIENHISPNCQSRDV